MKVREILKKLRADGWRVVRQTGSHRQLHHPRKAGTVTVAGKPREDLDPKTEKSILRTGYSVDVPDLPGCVAAAGTLKTARRLIAEAIGLHLDLMQQSGEALPAPRQSIEFTVDETAEEELCTWVEVKDPILPPTKERATARAGSEKKP